LVVLGKKEKLKTAVPESDVAEAPAASIKTLEARCLKRQWACGRNFLRLGLKEADPILRKQSRAVEGDS
jgi:hypothetical protein